MIEEEFDRQYEKATSSGGRILDEICCGAYFGSLSAEKLWEALVERIEERIDIEESEMKTILCELADRLGQLEEQNNPADGFYNDQGDGFCYKCRKGYTECRCNRISLELETAIANLGAEIAMATNALPARRIAGVMAALRRVEEEAGYQATK